MIYVASSWKNGYQPHVVDRLRKEGHEVYDFRDLTEGDHGFHWSEIDEYFELWTPDQYVAALDHPVAVKGYGKGLDALSRADAVVMVLPCGASSHMEAAWGIGRHIFSVVLIREPWKPELLYKMFDKRVTSLDAVVEALHMRFSGPQPYKGVYPEVRGKPW